MPKVLSDKWMERLPRWERTMKLLGWCLALVIALWLVSGLAFAEPGNAPTGKRVALEPVASELNSMPSHETMSQRSYDKSSFIVTEEYFIGPEDVLEISVWRNEDLSKQVVVRPDGRISLPLIGDVMAVGRTPAELTDVISARLKEYKENPSVAIVVQEVNSYALYVLGEVANPGKYPLKSKTTLLQGITIAGGFTAVAARNRIVVFRFSENSGSDIKIKASYDDIVLRDGADQNIKLKPGDTIVVPSETVVLIP